MSIATANRNLMITILTYSHSSMIFCEYTSYEIQHCYMQVVKWHLFFYNFLYLWTWDDPLFLNKDKSEKTLSYSLINATCFARLLTYYFITLFTLEPMFHFYMNLSLLFQMCTPNFSTTLYAYKMTSNFFTSLFNTEAVVCDVFKKIFL